MDPGILCFHHCQNKIFCTIIPERCPSCSVPLNRHDFNLLPFRVPYPFIKASQYPRAVLMKPTNGDFLNDYYNSKDLHIGVTTSKGNVIEFGPDGLQGLQFLDKTLPKSSYNSNWDQCLLVEQLQEHWSIYWDDVLLKVGRQSKWVASNYDEVKNNCLTFVLAFLRSLHYGTLSKTAQDPKLFCEQYIVQRTASAGKYISLYRQLKRHDHLVQKRSVNFIMTGKNFIQSNDIPSSYDMK